MSEAGKTVTSPANVTVKKLRSLGLKKYRDKEGLFLVEGLRHISDALHAEGWHLATLAYSERAKNDPLAQKAMAACAEAHGLCLEVTEALLQRITGRDNAQSVVGAFRHRWHELKDVKEGLWVGLEGIRDPGNLGTVIRTLDAVGGAGIVLIGDTCDPWSPEAVRATMGSFARVHIARATQGEFLQWRQGFEGRVIGTHLKTDTDYRQADYAAPLLLLMGSEGAGLSAELAQVCDSLVKIPMAGGAESLNLAVSSGIMLYEAMRKKL